MIKIGKIIMSFLLVLVLMLTTTGFTYFYNYCSCKDSFNVSLFSKNECCQSESQHCSEEASSECKIDYKTDACETHKVSCCGSEEHIVLLQTDILPVNKQDLKINALFVGYFFFVYNTLEQSTSINPLFADSHFNIPHAWGRKLVYLLNSPKIPSLS
ncbi:MAG: hypothetical protein IPO21_04245 [Bacteroidales bacterium]|nr:hypothetical protein [Bacteroidales bacterium]